MKKIITVLIISLVLISGISVFGEDKQDATPGEFDSINTSIFFE